MDTVSDGSNSSSGGNNDLLVKYQTIATEYSKARAQLNILKKAIVDEQNRSVELKETLRQFEQSGRKAEQEIDSLAFRNQQLTCRVTVLQDELEELQQNRGKKNKGKQLDAHHNSDITNHVIDEEFRKKIAENAELLSLMHEKEEVHVEEVAALTERLDNLQRLLEQSQKANADSEEKFKATVTKLEREKIALREGSEGLGSVAEELAQLQCTHAQYKIEMEARLAEATAIISSHLPSFIDSTNGDLTNVDSSRINEIKRAPLPPRLVQLVWTEVADASWALTEFHRHSEIRLARLPQSQSSSSNYGKYSTLLKECTDLTKDLEREVREVAAGINDETTDVKAALNRIPNHLANYCTKIETLMPLLRISLEDEDEHSTDEDVKNCTNNVVGRTSQFVSHIVQLNSIITLASKQKSFHQRQEQELIDIFALIVEDTKEMFDAYITKFNKESNKSDLSEDVNEANSGITSALSKLTDSTSKIVSGLKQLWLVETKKQPTVTTDFTKRATNYLNCVQGNENKSAPYLDALKSLEEAKHELELRQGLQKQLVETQAEIINLDRQCEHWKHEYNILKMKHEEGDVLKPMEPIDGFICERQTVVNMLGSVEIPFNLTPEFAEREDKIKKYFLERINKLISEKQEAQSKAAALSSECTAVTRRLESSIEQARKCDVSVQELKEKILHLQEELATTSTSYEAQLSTMSDHLATMNERLASQRETIDNLQYQINNKNNRKGKK